MDAQSFQTLMTNLSNLLDVNWRNLKCSFKKLSLRTVPKTLEASDEDSPRWLGARKGRLLSFAKVRICRTAAKFEAFQMPSNLQPGL